LIDRVQLSVTLNHSSVVVVVWSRRSNTKYDGRTQALLALRRDLLPSRFVPDELLDIDVIIDVT